MAHDDTTRTLIDAAVEHLPMPEIDIAAVPGVAAIRRHANTAVDLVDLEKFGPAPRRIRQTVAHETPRSFWEYVNRFGGSEASIFACLDDRSFTALLDYHGLADPSWVTHRATYRARFSPAFEAWSGAGRMAQRQFADFLEDRAGDSVNPEPADLMETAQNFEVIRNVDFRSVVNVSTNQRQFKFEEKDTIGGTVSCPKMLHLRTPVFAGTEPTDYAVRIAYDIKDGALTFILKVHRAQELIEAEFERIYDAIAVEAAPARIYRGKAA